MTDRERRRRAVLLSCSFVRNLAFYRVGQRDWVQPLHSSSHPQASFWRQANSNFLDMCVLDWCKLLGDGNAEHHWRRVVSNPSTFELGLLRRVGMDAAAFQAYIGDMRLYRDKFVVQLDELPVMNIPILDVANAAVRFYHGHVTTHEIKPGELAGIPADTTEKLIRGYDQCLDEAEAVFRLALFEDGAKSNRDRILVVS